MSTTTRTVLAALAVALVACSESEPEEDMVFEGAHGGTCTLDLDGTLTDWNFELQAEYDEETAEISGTVTTVDFQGYTLTGEIDGIVIGNTFDMNLYGEGVAESGDYIFDVDVEGEAVEWWFEGSCATWHGYSGSLFMR